MTPEQFLASKAAASRQAFYQQRLRANQAQQNRQQFNATVAEFHADSGLYRLRDESGAIVQAEGITTGTLQGVVSLYRPSQGRASIDGIP